MTSEIDKRETDRRPQALGWQIAVAVFVAIGCLATAGYAWFETFRG